MENGYRIKLLKQHQQPDWDKTHGCPTIAQLARLFKVKKMAEVGAAYGHTATEVLDKAHIVQYYMIDVWSKEEIYQTIIHSFGDDSRVVILRKDSILAAKDFNNESLDMVYLDTYHNYNQTVKEIHAWIKKVKRGGILVGDGYGYKVDGKEQVKRAVHEIFNNEQINVNLGKDYIYWIMRP
jgi:predicted O-methyltransferase YrrM